MKRWNDTTDQAIDAISVVVDGGRTVTIPRAAFTAIDPGFDQNTFEANMEFDYGYCLTVYKAQGSEWPHVLLVDECRSPQFRRDWLYTGARLILVVPA